MYRQRRRFGHLFGISLQRPTMIPSGLSGPGPCILLSAFLVLPHPSQLVGQLKCNLQCIVRKSARGPKGQQQHFAACLACFWHGLDWQWLLRLLSSCISMGSVSPYVPRFGAPSGVPLLGGVLNFARCSSLQVLTPGPGPPDIVHAHMLYCWRGGCPLRAGFTGLTATSLSSLTSVEPNLTGIPRKST